MKGSIAMAASATMKYASRNAVSGSNAYDLSKFRDYMPEEYGYGKPQAARSVSLPAGTRANGATAAARPASAQSQRTASRASAAPASKTPNRATTGAVSRATTGAVSRATTGTAARTASAAKETADNSRAAAAQPSAERKVSPVRRTAKKQQKAYGLSLFAVAGFAFVAVMMVFMLLAHVKVSEITTESAALQTRLDELTEEERKLKISYEDAFDVNRVEEYATNVLGMSKPLDTQVATVATAVSDKAVVVDEPAPEDGGGLDMGTFLASLVAYFK
jgi:cell division protein FtsB